MVMLPSVIWLPVPWLGQLQKTFRNIEKRVRGKERKGNKIKAVTTNKHKQKRVR